MQERNANLPPPARSRPLRLDLLHTFEAAARHLSFTRAGEELFLSQSAVSRQVQQLEESVGAALFERRHRALALTEAGLILPGAPSRTAWNGCAMRRPGCGPPPGGSRSLSRARPASHRSG